MDDTFVYIFHAEVVFFNADWDVFGSGFGDRDVSCVDVRNMDFVSDEYWDCDSSVKMVLL
jgi:hypothetical protein